jgi:hypothetical protein
MSVRKSAAPSLHFPNLPGIIHSLARSVRTEDRRISVSAAYFTKIATAIDTFATYD